MTHLYSWLALGVFTVAVLLAVWDTWQSTRPDDEEWFTEDDERRQPSWRRI